MQTLQITLVNVFSMLYLSFTLAFVLGVAEHDNVRKIVHSTLRRWFKLVGALAVLSIIVHIVAGL